MSPFNRTTAASSLVSVPTSTSGPVGIFRSRKALSSREGFNFAAQPPQVENFVRSQVTASASATIPSGVLIRLASLRGAEVDGVRRDRQRLHHLEGVGVDDLHVVLPVGPSLARSR